MHVQTECFKVTDKRGISAQPAAKLAQLTSKFDADIQIRQWNTDKWHNAKSIMSVLLLALSYRFIAEIKAEGSDAAEVISELSNLGDMLQVATEHDKNEYLALMQEKIDERKRYTKQRLKVRSTDVRNGIVVCRPKLKGELTKLIRESLGDAIDLRIYSEDEIYSEAHVLKLLEQHASFVVLPLSLPNYSAIRIAEGIHQNRLATRLILVSGTECEKNRLLNFFDAFIAPRDLSKATISAAFKTAMYRHTDQHYIDNAITAILSGANCFRTYGGRHQIGPKPSSNMEDYRENAGNRADLTLGACHRVERELYLVAEELQKLADLTDEEKALLQDINAIKNHNRNTYNYGAPGDPMFAVRSAALALQLNRSGRIHLDLPALTAARKSPPIFISYAHEDAAFVDNLEQSLAHSGHTIWRDLKSAVAGPLEKQVHAAIEQSIVVVVLTNASIKSDWVEWEVRKAREAQKAQGRYTLCPLALDESWKNSDWPSRLQAQIEEYLVLDFSQWQTPTEYSLVLEKLLGGLEQWYQQEK